jgi:hypothetical protein
MVKSLILDLTIRSKGDREQCMAAIQQLLDAGFELKLSGSNGVGPEHPNLWPHDDIRLTSYAQWSALSIASTK